MYAIRSYYVRDDAQEGQARYPPAARCGSRDGAAYLQENQRRSIADNLHYETVITSYSIHYTKLYEQTTSAVFPQLFLHRFKEESNNNAIVNKDNIYNYSWLLDKIEEYKRLFES